MESSSVSKILVNGKTLYMKLDWKENDNDLFHIKIFDGDHVWSGRYSNEFAKKYMEHIGESGEEYRKTAKKALLGNDSKIIYVFATIPGDKATAKFSWKKTFEDSTGKLEHGSVPVHLCDVSETKDMLIDFLLEQNKDLRQTIKEFEKKNEDLNVNLQECKDKLEQFVDIKNSLESNLYGKFVHLLNAKKQRIQLLEENLQKFGDIDPDVD